MTADARAWELLGIEPTSDVRAIKTAYARQLKTIDPETNPQAFVQLRWAFEEATNVPGRQEPFQPDAEAPGLESDYSPPPEYPVASDRQAGDPAEDHAQAITSLLYGHQGDPWLGPAARDKLISHWRSLMSDPRMDSIERYDAVELWARKVIVETSPLSAPILMIAAERFDWVDADGRARGDAYLDDIARRYRLLQLLRDASRPGTVWHPAWVELKEPADVMSNYGNVDPRRVFEILAAMRYALPGLEGEFDPHRVQSWEGRLSYVGVSRKNPSRWGGCIATAILAPLIIALAVWLSSSLSHAIDSGVHR